MYIPVTHPVILSQQAQLLHTQQQQSPGPPNLVPDFAVLSAAQLPVDVNGTVKTVLRKRVQKSKIPLPVRRNIRRIGSNHSNVIEIAIQNQTEEGLIVEHFKDKGRGIRTTQTLD